MWSSVDGYAGDDGMVLCRGCSGVVGGRRAGTFSSSRNIATMSIPSPRAAARETKAPSTDDPEAGNTGCPKQVELVDGAATLGATENLVGINANGADEDQFKTHDVMAILKVPKRVGPFELVITQAPSRAGRTPRSSARRNHRTTLGAASPLRVAAASRRSALDQIWHHLPPPPPPPPPPASACLRLPPASSSSSLAPPPRKGARPRP